DVKEFLAKVDRGIDPNTAVDLVIQDVLKKRAQLSKYLEKQGVSIGEFKRSAPDSSKKTKASSKKAISNASVAGAKDLKGGKYTINYHNDLLGAANEGRLSLSDFQAGLNALLDNKEDVLERLSKYTKGVLFNMAGAYLDSTTKKDELVTSAYDRIYRFYVLDKEVPALSFFMGEQQAAQKKHDEDVLAIARSVTESDLKDWAESRAEAVAKKAQRKAEFEMALSKPESLSDFNIYINHQMRNGAESKEAARMLLSPKQRRKLDKLKAESSRDKRAALMEKNRTSMAAGGNVENAEIIATKHTKKGHDLYVVRAGDRVEKDVYREWLSVAKRLGGYYSRFRGNGAVAGFQFTEMDSAEAFRDHISKGDNDSAKNKMAERMNAFEDNRSQSSVERLNVMADKIESKGNDSLSSDRKANTARRAGMAARAIEAAEADIALAKTMRNIAKRIESGSAELLDQVRTKAQVEMLTSMARLARSAQVRAKDLSYAESQKQEATPSDAETVDYAVWPEYTAYRSDIAAMAREALEQGGMKQIGAKILKVADDITPEYIDFAKENINLVATFMSQGKPLPAFKSKKAVEELIHRSGFKGRAIVLSVKRGENRVILSPSEAIKRGVWDGNNDKRITLDPSLIEPLIGKARKSHGMSVPWYFDSVKDKRVRLASMGVNNEYELRTALGEFISINVKPVQPSKIKEMERAMIGRAKDGLDFFPTPSGTADEMVSVAGIESGMTVLEPSAGMGHIAERIRESGVEPSVIEYSNKRSELLKEKGFNVVGDDFLEFDEGTYDRIIMNPPFSDKRDVAHVKHAYDMLNTNGRLVAIMSEHVFFASDKKAVAFREWLDKVGATDEKLEAGTFSDASLPVNTGVNARMVVIDKKSVRFSRAPTQ
ncbi:MAG: SAM-dependent methyltransferase, partial [Gammaproteobacteria bacterium]